MAQNKKDFHANEPSVEDLRYAAEQIVTFSRHLMTILVAAIAFTAAMLKVTTNISIYLVVSGIVLATLSFIFGYLTNSEHIDAHLQVDEKFKIKNELTHSTVHKMKKLLRGQYILNLMSLVILCAAIIFSFTGCP